MEITLPLIEYYVMSKQVKGCWKKTLVGFRSNLGKFINHLTQQDHSLKLSELTIHNARAFITSLQGTVTKYEGHTLTPAKPGCTYSPQTVHKHVTLRSWTCPSCRTRRSRSCRRGRSSRSSPQSNRARSWVPGSMLYTSDDEFGIAIDQVAKWKGIGVLKIPRSGIASERHLRTLSGERVEGMSRSLLISRRRG